MGMLSLSVEMHMLVDEVHSEQEILISENLIGTSHLLNPVILRKDDNPSSELSDQPKIMGGQDNRLSRFVKGKHELHKKDLGPGIETVGRFVK